MTRMMHVLFVYDRIEKKVIESRQFSDADEARRACSAAEEENSPNTNIEVWVEFDIPNLRPRR